MWIKTTTGENKYVNAGIDNLNFIQIIIELNIRSRYM